MAIAEIQDRAEEWLIHHFKTDRTQINCTKVDTEQMLVKGDFIEQDGKKWDFEIETDDEILNVKLRRVFPNYFGKDV